MTAVNFLRPSLPEIASENALSLRTCSANFQKESAPEAADDEYRFSAKCNATTWLLSPSWRMCNLIGTDKPASNNLKMRDSLPDWRASANAAYHEIKSVFPASIGNALAMTTADLPFKAFCATFGSTTSAGIGTLNELPSSSCLCGRLEKR